MELRIAPTSDAATPAHRCRYGRPFDRFSVDCRVSIRGVTHPGVHNEWGCVHPSGASLSEDIRTPPLRDGATAHMGRCSGCDASPDGCSEFGFGWSPLVALIGRIDATTQADGRIGIEEWVDTVNQDGR